MQAIHIEPSRSQSVSNNYNAKIM